MHKVKYHQRHENDTDLIIEARGRGFGDTESAYVVRTESPASPIRRILATLEFQFGDPRQLGVNGITDEALLAIVIDRLEHAQESPLACNQYQNALENIYLALQTLKARKHQLAIEKGDL